MGTLDRIIEGALRRRALVLVGVALLIALGVWSVLRIPIDAFPDVTNIQVEVLSTVPGMSPPEVERFVTYPVETAMRGLPRLDQVRSVSKAGLSVVTVVFEDGVDVYFARQLVLERLIEARERVPQGTEIVMGPVSTAMGEVYQYTLAGERPAGTDEMTYLTEVRTAQDWVLAPLLKSIPGVSEINSFGGAIKQYHVVVDPDRLHAYDLTLADVGEALRRNNLNVGGNILEHGEQQYLVRGVGLLQTVGDIGAVALKTEAGTPVLVRDVAEVSAGQAVRQGGAVKDGKGEVVGGVVMMLRGANGRDVVRAVERRVGEINGSGVLPLGLRIEPYYKRSDIIDRAIHTVTEALLVGSVLVVLVLYLFLRSFRGAFIVLLALPLSMLFTFVMMRAVGLSANLMSLGGLAISIGMIIDATIIQVENVQRHLSEAGAAARRLPVVLRSVLEVRKPSIFGELIIALTFIPIIALQGIEGKMFLPLAFTHVIALLASLLLSLAAIPAFCHLLLKPHPDKRSFLVEGAKKAYLPVLRWSLRHKAVVVAAAVALLAGTAFLVPRLGTEFMPVMDEGALDTDIQFLPGISLAESLDMSRKVEARLMEFPELVTIVGKTGQTGIALEARGVEKTGYVGVLKPRGEWTSARTREELTDRMREAMEEFPGMAFSFSQPIACRIDELVAGTRAQLIVKLFGEDLDVLKDRGAAIAAVLGRVRGATDVTVESVAGQPYITVEPDRARIARLGLNVEDVQAVVETAVGGKTVTELYEGDRYFDLQLRYPEERRNSPETIGAILVRTPGGARVPLGQIAEITMLEGPQPDQPRVRPAPDRGRVQHQRPRPGRVRRRSPPGHRPRRAAPAGILPRLRRPVREPAAGHAAAGDHPAGHDRPDPLPALPDLRLAEAVPARHPRPAVRPHRRGPGALLLRALPLRPGLGRLHRPVRHRRPQRHRPALVHRAAPGGGEAARRGRRRGLSQPPAARAHDGDDHRAQPRAAALRPGPRLGDPAAPRGRRRRRADLLDPADAAGAPGAVQLVRRRQSKGEARA